MKPRPAENEPDLLDTLKQWQVIEDGTVAHTTLILEKTANPVIRLIMEIIRQDSVMHRRVQQVLIDGLEKQAFSLTPEEVADIWGLIEKHDDMEKETIVLAEKARKNCRLLIHRQLLSYLLEDEQKHERLLAYLDDVKRGIYPYA